VDYTFTVLDDRPYLFVDGRLRLPATNKTDLLKADARHLSRQLDLGWQEVAPAELRFAQQADRRRPVRVLKHNYVDIHSSYDLDYFRHSNRNLSLDNVNNHITADYAGIAAGGSGLAVAMDKSVSANFAFAPIKVRYDVPSESFSARVNPFGTYHGRQYRHPTWGNRQGWEAAQISGEQYHSAAPTFNGRTIRFGLMVAFFNGDQVPDTVRHELKSYANPAVAYSLRSLLVHPDPSRQPEVPTQLCATYRKGRVTLSWEGDTRGVQFYRLYCGPSAGKYTYRFQSASNMLTLDELSPNLPFEIGQRYYATVEAVGFDGTEPVRTEEMNFDIIPVKNYSATPKLPWKFPLKVLWANLNAFIRKPFS
jgi:hypothetical protein